MAYYDRILVLDAGRVVEYDTPLRLFDRAHSIFRSLCDRVVSTLLSLAVIEHLRRHDLARIRHDAVFASEMARDRSSLMYHFNIADAWNEQGPIDSSVYPRIPLQSVSSRFSR